MAQQDETKAALFKVLDLAMKNAEIFSWQAIEHHKRLQNEVYVRMKARSDITNYVIGATVGICAAVSFLFPEHLSRTMGGLTNVDDFNLHQVFVVGCLLILAAYLYVFFTMSFLSHTGHIYAASNVINNRLPETLSRIQAFLNEGVGTLGLDFSFSVDPKGVFYWEEELEKSRSAYGFSDTGFEVNGFLGVSMFSLVAGLGFCSIFYYLLVVRNRGSDLLLAIISLLIIVILVLVYILMLIAAWRTYRKIKAYRRSIMQAVAK